MLTVFTDGAYSNKSKCGGWAFCVPAATLRQWIVKRGAVHGTTNNLMELRAIREALLYAIRTRGDNVIVVTDSQYAITVITSPRGYITNAEPIAELRRLCDVIRTRDGSVTFKWVKGHRDTLGNIFADVASCRARDELAKRLASG